MPYSCTVGDISNLQCLDVELDVWRRNQLDEENISAPDRFLIVFICFSLSLSLSLALLPFQLSNHVLVIDYVGGSL